MKSVLYIAAVMFFYCSCKKLVEIDAPVTSVNVANVFGDDISAISALNGIYTNMSGNGAFSGTNGISLRTGLSADEFGLSSQVSDPNLPLYYRNSLNVNATAGSEFWPSIYRLIFFANSAIEGLESSTSLTPAVKSQLIGEAKFIRSFFYFYLVNLYGDVPLLLSTDYKKASQLSKSSSSAIYNQIIGDLKEAQVLLLDYFPDATLLKPSSDRVRPTRWAAIALLARVYLYVGDWVNAETQSSSIISNNSLFALNNPDIVFLKASLNNKEAIWQLQPINTGWNTEDAKAFIINGSQGNSKPIYLSQGLLNSFEPLDLRVASWIKDTTISNVKYSYPYKYKIATLNSPVSENLMVLRLGEQYLIRSEARSMQNKYQMAIDDINLIRLKHGGLIDPLPPPLTLTAAQKIVLQEKRVELFSEWGHRWFDLKRTTAIDTVMKVAAVQKGSSWQLYQSLYPIPVTDIQQNLNIIQNNGYK